MQKHLSSLQGLNNDENANQEKSQRSHSQSSKNSNKDKKDTIDVINMNEIDSSSFRSSEDSLTLNEKLENANQQIKDLQDYIKKKSLEDIKNNQLKIEA